MPEVFANAGNMNSISSDGAGSGRDTRRRSLWQLLAGSVPSCKAGVKTRCLAQYEGGATSGHHRVSKRFLDPGHPQSLRTAIDAMSDDGTGMSPDLAAVVQGLSWVPLDDCICEGPHAQAKRIKMPASGAKWAWVAASMRLQQNISDCRSLPSTTSVSLRSVWSGSTSVVQPPSSCHKVPRLNLQALQRRLYRLDHLMGFTSGKLQQPPALLDAGMGGDELDAISDGGGHEHNLAPLQDEQDEARLPPVFVCHIGRRAPLGAPQFQDRSTALVFREGKLDGCRHIRFREAWG